MKHLPQHRHRQLFQGLYGAGLSAIAWMVMTAPVLAQPLEGAIAFQPQIWLNQALQWIDSLGFVGGLAFILLYILATVVFLPGSLLTLGAGVVFGVVLGTVYVFVGATLGALAAFLIGRYLARGWVSQKIEGNSTFAAIDQAVAQEGFKVVVLTRLSPIFPFNLLNYAFGITGVAVKDYALGSIGMIPGTILYVYIGSLAGDLARIGTTAASPDPTITWSVRIIGLIATIAITLFITRIARQALTVKADE